MPVPVLVLAAGLGTRLRPLTDWLPKPLLPVGDRPAIEHILSVVRPIGGPIVANAHHRAADLRAFVEASAGDVVLSEEAHILGTAGGLARAADLLGAGDVLVWNGDILASIDPGHLVRAHAEAGDAEATLAVRPLPRGEGNVGVDASGHVVRLRGETIAPGEVRGGAFLGIHVVGERLRAALPPEGCLVGDVYLPALRRRQTLRVFEAPDIAWQDIGTLADYVAANQAWLETLTPPGPRPGKNSTPPAPRPRDSTPPAPRLAWQGGGSVREFACFASHVPPSSPGEEGGQGEGVPERKGARRKESPSRKGGRGEGREPARHGSFVAEGAKVAAGVSLQSCIIGRNARVEGAGTLDRCIVWPDTRVTAPCRPSVVTPWGTVSLGPGLP